MENDRTQYNVFSRKTRLGKKYLKLPTKLYIKHDKKILRALETRTCLIFIFQDKSKYLQTILLCFGSKILIVVNN